MKKISNKTNSPHKNQEKSEGGPAVLHPTHQNIAYTPRLNQKLEAAKKKEEENESDELD